MYRPSLPSGSAHTGRTVTAPLLSTVVMPRPSSRRLRCGGCEAPAKKRAPMRSEPERAGTLCTQGRPRTTTRRRPRQHRPPWSFDPAPVAARPGRRSGRSARLRRQPSRRDSGSRHPIDRQHDESDRQAEHRDQKSASSSHQAAIPVPGSATARRGRTTPLTSLATASRQQATMTRAPMT